MRQLSVKAPFHFLHIFAHDLPCGLFAGRLVASDSFCAASCEKPRRLLAVHGHGILQRRVAKSVDRVYVCTLRHELCEDFQLSPDRGTMESRPPLPIARIKGNPVCEECFHGFEIPRRRCKTYELGRVWAGG